jgi:hypothetical protein
MFGSAIAGIINVPADYPSIQAGINAAFPGDTVLVADSTYYENISFKGKAITVASHFIVDGDTTHIDSTIIDGSQPSHPDSGSVVFFVSGEDTNSVICGFTITGGIGTILKATNETGKRIGGGVCIISSSARIMYNNITRNNVTHSRGSHGGGIAITCETIPRKSFVKIMGNSIINNQALSTNDWGYGGGIDIVFGEVHLEENIVSFNKVGGSDNCYGAGIRFMGFYENAILSDNNISFNEATNGSCYGGGLLVEGSADVKIIRNIFKCNCSQSGGGLLYQAPGGVIAHNTFVNNHSTFIGGGLEIRSNGFVLYNTFTDNTSEGFGGGIGVSFCSPHIYNNVIYENMAGEGGGLYIGEYFCRPEIINTTIVDNTAGTGGGISTSFSSPIIMNTILWGNRASNEPQIYIVEDSRFGPLRIVYCDVQGGFADVGNIDQDPKLSTPFVLLESSPCIGVGIDTFVVGSKQYCCPPTDLNGNVRPSPAGSMPDIGAIESSFGSPTTIELFASQNTQKTCFLHQNYPNPFNPSTTIEFALLQPAFITLKVYNLLGEQVALLVAEKRLSGIHKVSWDARGLASGVYLYRLEAGDLSTIFLNKSGQAGRGFVQTKKLILMR